MLSTCSNSPSGRADKLYPTKQEVGPAPPGRHGEIDQQLAFAGRGRRLVVDGASDPPSPIYREMGNHGMEVGDGPTGLGI